MDTQAAAVAAGKRELRRVVLARRDAIPADERTRRSKELCRKLADELHGQMTIAVYAAMRSEVDLTDAIDAAYRYGARIAFPCMQGAPDAETAGKRQQMVMRLVDEASWREGTAPFIIHPVKPFILQEKDPGTGCTRFPLIQPAGLDLVLVPLVAFDDAGMRLGYGGGNYDRYLPHLRPGCRIAGVAFKEQRVPRVPAEEYDRPLPRILVA